MNRILKLLSVFILLMFSCAHGIERKSLNLDFEIINHGASLPKNWYAGGEGFTISLDSLEKHAGEFSLKMEILENTNNTFGVFTGLIPKELAAGKKVEYKGWIKTEGVKNGYVGLWFRVDGENSALLGFDNMNERGLKGDNDWTQVSIKMDVDKNAENILFGGIFPGEGVAWFDNLELYIDGEKYIDVIEPPAKSVLSETEISTLKKYLYPLRTFEPDNGGTEDLKVLDRMIGSSKVVALGEVSHGSSEIFKMKNRIIQYLAANHGFDIFSIEANMPEAYKVNDYVIQGKNNPKKLIADMYFWTWRTEEVLDMVEWMRKFNQTEQRIEFTGFDMQFYEGAVDELFDAFEGDTEAENKITKLREFLDETRKNSRYNNGMVSVDDDAMKEIKSLISSLTKRIKTASFQTAKKEWLLQNITIIRQYLEMNNFSWRDKCMADNFLWIKEHNPKSKFVIWAHNAHIKKTDQMMGAHLSQKLGGDYTTFGFSFFEGSFTAAGSKGLTSYNAIQAYPGTLEYLLEQLNEPIFILDLKKIKADNPKDIEWLRESIEYRKVGALGGTPNEFSEGKIMDNFDYFIFIKTSTPSAIFATPQ